MVDFTTIQTNEIPQDIRELQKSNINLKDSNKNLRKTIYFIIGGALIISLFILIQNKKKYVESLNYIPNKEKDR